MTFMEDYQNGLIDACQIGDYMDRYPIENDGLFIWQYLGMTREQALIWLTTGELPERGSP